jgi:hypothetical protein
MVAGEEAYCCRGAEYFDGMNVSYVLCKRKLGQCINSCPLM